MPLGSGSPVGGPIATRSVPPIGVGREMEPVVVSGRHHHHTQKGHRLMELQISDTGWAFRAWVGESQSLERKHLDFKSLCQSLSLGYVLIRIGHFATKENYQSDQQNRNNIY